MARYGEQGAFFAEEPYRVEVAPADIQPELAELDRLETESMEAYYQERLFGKDVLETVGV